MAIKSKARHDLTLRSIKREIAAGRGVAYWLDKAYSHLDSGLLTEEDIAEVEALAQAYYDALDAEDRTAKKRPQMIQRQSAKEGFSEPRCSGRRLTVCDQI